MRPQAHGKFSIIQFWKTFLVFLLAIFCSIAVGQENDTKNSPPEISAPVTPYIFNGSLRDLPDPQEWQPGDPIKEIPRRIYPQPSLYPQEPRPVGLDPLLQLQDGVVTTPSDFTVPNRNFDGGTFTGVNPPDTVGDVGTNHYIQAINSGSGSQVRIWNKAEPTPLLLETFTLDTLGSGPCASGLGDPIVLYDRNADRWLISEFSGSANRLCVYISQTNDPVDGGWFNYAFTTPSFPDYPKYSIWPTDKDGGQGSYVVTTNEGAPIVYALNRGAMLAGSAGTLQRFTNIPPLSGFGFQGVHIGADIDGPTLPPALSKAPILLHRDTEVHGPPGNPTQDFLDLWELNISWTAPGTSTLVNTFDIPIAEIDSELCGLFSFNCFPQPSSGVTLDPLREPVMHRLQYINHGTHQTLVGNLVTDVDGTDHGGMRWFELRGGSGAWSLFQEGTYSIDIHHRWIGGISMDSTGNIAMGYSVCSTTVHPDMRYTGRESGDTLGTMPESETVIVDGTASNGSNRWGDYAAMSLDPSDDCTFWYTNMYNISPQWRTRVASFRFDSCGTGCPTITISPTSLPNGFTNIPYSQTVVASGGTAPYTYSVSSGTLPNGLNLDASTGALTGTPTTPGTFNFTITATDSNTCTGSRNYSITINNCPTITLSPSNLPDGPLGLPYNQTVVAIGGTAPYTYSVTSGSLPTGLGLNSSTGAISGTPNTLGTFNFTITATDTNTCTGSQNYSITITNCPAITLSPTTLPDGTVGTAYNQTVVASGGATPYTYAVSSGSLPSGLSLASSTGVISGTPDSTGTSNFQITATDDDGCTGSQNYSITINSACLYCDDFEDGLLAANWTYIKPTWNETGGTLQGSSNKKAIAVANSVFSGCLNCTVEASMQTLGGSGNRTWLLAWYISKLNTMELLMKEENDTWVLKQRSNGSVVAKAKASATIDPNVAYAVEVSFNGTEFTVTVDGNVLITMTPVGVVAPGTVGFQAKATTGTFGYIIVN